MRALVLNCTLKPSPALSNTEALTDVVIAALREKDVEVEAIRVVDRDIPPGVETISAMETGGRRSTGR